MADTNIIDDLTEIMVTREPALAERHNAWRTQEHRTQEHKETRSGLTREEEAVWRNRVRESVTLRGPL